MTIPRAEYPRPQFERASWLNLNGEWSYEFDFSQSGLEKDYAKSTGFAGKINVPFCPESSLSGVGFTDYIPEMWYEREVAIPKEWKGKKIFFRCAGIDYFMELYIDGVFAGTHTGVASPVEIAIEDLVKPGKKHHFVVRAKDDPRSNIQPLGKQSRPLKSAGCSYTRTTGIWQTVWLEAADPRGLAKCTVTPDFDNGAFGFAPHFYTPSRNCTLTVRVMDGKKCAGEVTTVCSDTAALRIALNKPKAWRPGSPFLYDIEFTVRDAAGKVIDRVTSYAGLRKFHVEGDRIYFNNEEIFLRFVLDQGFYPDGIWTAPSDKALKRDVELSMEAGFNGARLHQKVFEERFHYWADKLGYLTWAEFPDWGMGFWQHFSDKPGDYNLSFRNYMAEWSAVVERQINHPSIIAWTPFNETAGYTDLAEHRRMISDVYDLTKRLDPTRPVNDTSGYAHAKTDLWTAHDYAPDGKTLQEDMSKEPVFMNIPEAEAPAYKKQPYILDEYGGVRYLVPGEKPYAENSWGYGGTPKTAAAALARIEDLTKTILKIDHIRGYCYTQLTNVEQEENGIYTYSRKAKFDMKKVKAIFSAEPEK